MFGNLVAVEGTNADETMPDRQHPSATPSPRATYTPDFQIHKPNSYFVIFFLQISIRFGSNLYLKTFSKSAQNQFLELIKKLS